MTPRTTLAAAIAFSFLMVGQPARAFADDARVSTLGKDTTAAAAETGRAIKKGTEDTARYSEAGGRFLVRLLKHMKTGPLPYPTNPW